LTIHVRLGALHCAGAVWQKRRAREQRGTIGGEIRYRIVFSTSLRHTVSSGRQFDE
jgi:hypothetical protein